MGECWHTWVRIEKELTSDNREKQKCSKCGLTRIQRQDTSATANYPIYLYEPIVKNHSATQA